MKLNPSDKPVRITGEERLHPALRKLGRACIALARWQREQDTASETVSEPHPTKKNAATTGTNTPSASKTEASAQEPRHDY